MSARKRLFDYVNQKGINHNYNSKELQEVGAVDDWARSLRQLRQDDVLLYEYDSTKREYRFTEINEYSNTTKRAGLTSKTKYRIRNRDGHLCQSCGKGVKDGVKLHVDHKIPLELEGTNLDDNLWTLCDDCNQGKKDFYSDDFDIEVMTKVFQEKSGYQRLRVLFELSPNKGFTPSVIQGIAGIRDWTRTIRNIRDKYGINIQWFKPDEENPNGYYANV